MSRQRWFSRIFRAFIGPCHTSYMYLPTHFHPLHESTSVTELNSLVLFKGLAQLTCQSKVVQFSKGEKSGKQSTHDVTMMIDLQNRILLAQKFSMTPDTCLSHPISHISCARGRIPGSPCTMLIYNSHFSNRRCAWQASCPTRVHKIAHPLFCALGFVFWYNLCIMLPMSCVPQFSERHLLANSWSAGK